MDSFISILFIDTVKFIFIELFLECTVHLQIVSCITAPPLGRHILLMGWNRLLFFCRNSEFSSPMHKTENEIQLRWLELTIN